MSRGPSYSNGPGQGQGNPRIGGPALFELMEGDRVE